MTNLQAYQNYHSRTEKYFAKKFWSFAAVFTVLGILQSFLPFPWLVRALLFTAIFGKAIVLWQLYAIDFESNQEMKVVLTVNVIFLLLLDAGLVAAIWYLLV